MVVVEAHLGAGVAFMVSRMTVPLIFLVACLPLVLSSVAIALNVSPGDALASWNDGGTKQAILNFTARVTRTDSPDLVPVEVENDLSGFVSMRPVRLILCPPVLFWTGARFD